MALGAAAESNSNLCSWQSKMSKALFRPAEMYHGPVKVFGLNSLTSPPPVGTGHEPSSARCGTQSLAVTAHLVNWSTAGLLNLSPHVIWQSPSSGWLLQVWMQTRLAKHDPSVMHFARGAVHWVTTHVPTAAASSASAGCGFTTGETVLPKTRSAASAPRTAEAGSAATRGLLLPASANDRPKEDVGTRMC